MLHFSPFLYQKHPKNLIFPIKNAHFPIKTGTNGADRRPWPMPLSDRAPFSTVSPTKLSFWE
jgi:hypothetical protein